MRTYKDIYSFQTIDEIKSGKDVYVVDKENMKIYYLNGMTVEEFVYVVNCDNRNDRFSFYVVEETKETNE